MSSDECGDHDLWGVRVEFGVYSNVSLETQAKSAYKIGVKELQSDRCPAVYWLGMADSNGSGCRLINLIAGTMFAGEIQDREN